MFFAVLVTFTIKEQHAFFLLHKTAGNKVFLGHGSLVFYPLEYVSSHIDITLSTRRSPPERTERL